MNWRPNAAIKPCPFCGATTNDYGTAHAHDCYFTLQRQLNNAPDGDLSLAPAVLEAWNRRVPTPGVTLGGEADAWWRPKVDVLMRTVEVLRDALHGERDTRGKAIINEQLAAIRADIGTRGVAGDRHQTFSPSDADGGTR